MTSAPITRRGFIGSTLAAGTAAGAAMAGCLPYIASPGMANAQPGNPPNTLRFAWISDTHLDLKPANSRFIERALRAAREVRAMDPPADFLIFGGDLAQFGDPAALELGAQILGQIGIKTYFIPGELDWYRDMGTTWTEMFGQTPWTFDHKAVRFIGLDTVSRAADFWTLRKMSAKQRIMHIASLDGGLGGGWASVGIEQLDYITNALSDWPKDQPIVIFSHNPLYDYYAGWNFWVRDWQLVQEALRPYSNVTNLHGHCHQLVVHAIDGMRFLGMPATSWPWPYAPESVPALTRPIARTGPDDPFAGVGWGNLTFDRAKLELGSEITMWRRDSLAANPESSTAANNSTQIVWPRHTAG